MSHDSSFRDLFQRVRAGDASAAEQLVRTYEPDIRRTIRVRLTDARLRQLVDSVDICQSVLANFFVRAASGQFDIETPGQLVGLLVTMARNRITDLARRERAERRDGQRTVSLDGLLASASDIAATEASPSTIAAGRELLTRVRAQLKEVELQILEWRTAGCGWIEIAERLDSHPNTVRMRYVRALDRVSAELGLGVSAHV